MFGVGRVRCRQNDLCIITIFRLKETKHEFCRDVNSFVCHLIDDPIALNHKNDTKKQQLMKKSKGSLKSHENNIVCT